MNLLEVWKFLDSKMQCDAEVVDSGSDGGTEHNQESY